MEVRNYSERNGAEVPTFIAIITAPACSFVGGRLCPEVFIHLVPILVEPNALPTHPQLQNELGVSCYKIVEQRVD